MTYEIKLTPYAKIFYNEWLLNPDSYNYHIVIDQILHGDLDIPKLKNALSRYVSEHVILNSHIKKNSEIPCWVPNLETKELEYIDNFIDTVELFNYVTKGFDVHTGPLYRFRLLKIKDQVYRFVIVLHHLVIDGSSTDKGLFEAITKYYNDKNHIAEYSIEEQIKMLGNLEERLSSDLENNKPQYKRFWRKQLKNIDTVDLKFLKFDQGNLKDIHPVGEIKFNYKKPEIDKFNFIKRKHLVTPYIYSLCIFALLINRFTNKKQFAISYATSIKEGLNFIYGAEVNTNFIPFKFGKAITFVDLLEQSRSFFSSLKSNNLNYSYLPISDIITGDDKKLLNLYFIQPNFKDKSFTFNGITKTEILSEFNLDAVDPMVFELALGNQNQEFNFRIRFDKRVINEELLEFFVSVFQKLFVEILDDLFAQKNKLLSSYNIVDSKQFQKLVYDFNQTENVYPRDETLDLLFAEQVKKHPNKTAVIFKDEQITYKELDDKTNKVAHYLSQKGLKSGDVVGIYMQRSLDSLVAIIGIIKAGGVYVPLDPAYPSNRINYMVKDSGCRVCLTSNDQLLQCSNFFLLDPDLQDKVEVIAISEIESIVNNKASTFIPKKQNALYTAYIMYTSGSTGNPKGICITHRGIVRLVKNPNYIGFEDNSIISHATSISFDISTFEIWGTLLNGLTMVVVPSETLSDFNELAKLLHQHAVSIMCMAPILFNTIVLKHCFALSRLKYLLICGEKFSPYNIPQFFQNNKFARLLNCYGPTECTSYATAFEIPHDWLPTKEIPIGKPISNTTVFVLDENLQILPIGAIGELCLGGDGLAKDYHGNDQLTAEKFVNVKLTDKKEMRLYRTGDLVRMLPDGNLEFIGRNDLQVKIRGYRVELGEIEAKLLSYPGVKEAVVILKELVRADSEHVNEKYLVAYYTSENQLDEIKIKTYLATQLPNYMLPSILTYLEKMPQTINGKIDYKSLPEFVFMHNSQYLPPTNEQERFVCDTYAKILKRKKIGIDDDFFSLGGDSLKAISLVSNLQDNFDIKVADIFEYRTPEKIVANVNFVKGVFKQKIEQIKLLFQNRAKQICETKNQEQEKIERYLKNIANLNIDLSLKKPIKNILLTGVTGYLGCNILNQLLLLTSYKIFLLIRADSKEKALKRIKEKFELYFEKKIDHYIESRVFVIEGDLEKNFFGLSKIEYQNLASKIDSIIHAAALVKQYGEYDKFYSVNVQSTINLLEFCKLTSLKDFHYISSCAVLNFGFITNKENYLFTEDDLPKESDEYYNVYSKTKLQAEHQVIKYYDQGVNGNIYRLGNLAFMMENSLAQENIDDNGFFSFMQFLLKKQCIAKEFDNVEISPVDLTAQAIIKLFDKTFLSNNIFHIFNPYLFNLSKFFTYNKILPFKLLEMENFIDNLSQDLGKEDYDNLVIKFLSHKGWLDGLNNISSFNVLQEKTQYILKKLNFEWIPISDDVFTNYLKKTKLLRK